MPKCFASSLLRIRPALRGGDHCELAFPGFPSADADFTLGYSRPSLREGFSDSLLLSGRGRRLLRFGERADVDDEIPDLIVAGATVALGRHLVLADADDVEQLPVLPAGESFGIGPV